MNTTLIYKGTETTQETKITYYENDYFNMEKEESNFYSYLLITPKDQRSDLLDRVAVKLDLNDIENIYAIDDFIEINCYTSHNDFEHLFSITSKIVESVGD